MVPIEPGKFVDFGCRFRYNKFHRTDYWWTAKKKLNPFFDYVFYSSDVLDVPPGNTLMVEFYFRLDVDQIEHSRVVFSFMDFIGSLGGVP
jgi:hypothetical protein